MKIKIKNSEKGYTLVELLTVIVIMVVVGMIVTGIIVSSLRGTNKSTVLDNVRENGNYTIVQMSKMLTFARVFNGVSKDGISYTTNCTVAATPTPAPSTTPAPTATPVAYKYVKITGFDGGTTVFGCNSPTDTPPNTIASNSSSLIDTSTVSVDYSSCTFTCSQNTLTEPPTIGINFQLSQVSASSFVEKNATIPFSTSVTLRNIGY